MSPPIQARVIRSTRILSICTQVDNGRSQHAHISYRVKSENTCDRQGSELRRTRSKTVSPSYNQGHVRNSFNSHKTYHDHKGQSPPINFIGNYSLLRVTASRRFVVPGFQITGNQCDKLYDRIDCHWIRMLDTNRLYERE